MCEEEMCLLCLIFLYLNVCCTCRSSMSTNSMLRSRIMEKGQIQSTFIISNSKGLSEIIRDIRTSTYQVCRIKEK